MKLIFFLLIPISVHAQILKDVDWSIYGNDDRTEFSKTSSKMRKLADSTAALIVNSFLVKQGSKFLIDGPTLDDQDGVCAEERFRDQPAVSQCSGTLIADDLILTASHCYDHKGICEHASWVFGYHDSKNGKYQIKARDVYGCKEVVYQKFDLENGIDFALVRLDRKVKKHKPVKLRQDGELSLGTKLAVIGHPRGLPTKIAENGEVLSVSGNTFMTNLDTFTGNSGSGVFNAETLELEGIVSYGKDDFKEDESRSCLVSQVYLLSEGEEAVMGIAPLREIIKSQQSTRP